jgi:predicted SnoaL-like aldol condensation-catalyzing enzyme
VLADDDYVTVVMPREYDHPSNTGEKYTSTWFYLWRVVDGKLDEHWAPATLQAR